MKIKRLIRIIIADYHELFRQGLKALLANRPEFRVVAEVERASDLKKRVTRQRCEVIILDLQMDQWVMEEIKWLARRAAVVVLTAIEDPEHTAAAIRLGAHAVVSKRFPLDILIAAINAAAGGLVWLPPTTAAEFAQHNGNLRRIHLTKRESAIVCCVSEGLRNSEVAQQLAISENTVKTHLFNIFRKLEVRDRVELAHYAIRTGLINVQ